ncbi:MAG TPA: hypothetical protein VK742_02850 [Candidatus Sulfotelmatobacter sp.]|nr:hypothetical protein [Candidatus Sulfotelmatobacter sp.]
MNDKLSKPHPEKSKAEHAKIGLLEQGDEDDEDFEKAEGRIWGGSIIIAFKLLGFSDLGRKITLKKFLHFGCAAQGGGWRGA